MRVYIFERDSALLNMLMIFLKGQGHQVQGFLEGYTCPLYLLDECNCPANIPCAEAVIVNTRVPDQESIQLLLDQARKGCKLPNKNKAVMSANFNPVFEQFIEEQGFSVIKKPFRLSAMTDWLKECESRLTV